MADSPERESGVHFRLVGRLALIFATTATATLVALLLVVGDDPGQEYGSIIGSRLRSQVRLEITLWSFGLLVTALSGLTTWLLALYTSFRFAGPIWRFSRNLEQAIFHGPVTPIPLRRDDLLQVESTAMRAASDRLREQYELVGEALMQWQTEPTPGLAQAVISRLRELDSRARL